MPNPPNPPCIAGATHPPQGPSRRGPWDPAPWLPAITLAGLLLAGRASDPQDSAEMLAVGRCMLGVASCEGWDPTWRPPLPPLLGALLQPLIPGTAALVLVAAASLALWTVPAARLARRAGGTGWLVGALVLTLPVTRLHGLITDARAPALLLLTWAAVLLDREDRRGGWACGLAVGAAALCRPEAIAFVPLALLASRQSRFAALGALMALGPWWAAVSAWRGSLTLMPRAWELAPASWASWMTVPVVHQLVGPTSFDTPLRAQLAASGLVPEARPELGVALDVVVRALPEVVPWWLLLPVAIGALALRDHRRLAAILAVAAGSALAATTLIQGRSLPESTLLPVALVAIVLADVGAARAGAWLARFAPRREVGRTGLVPTLALGVLAVALAGPLRRPPGESEAAPRALVSRLHELPAQSRVATIFSSFYLTERAGLTPTRPEDGAELLVLTDTDDPWLALGLIPGRWDVAQIVAADGRHAALLRAVPDASARVLDEQRLGMARVAHLQ